MLLPLLAIGISGSIVLGIVIRKLPQLSLLDIETLPEVQQGKTKDILLKKRAEKQALVVSNILKERLKPVIRLASYTQKEFRNYVSKVQRTVHHEARRMRKEPPIENAIEQKIEVSAPVVQERDQLLHAAQRAAEEQNYVEAEKKCIAIIKQDAQCVDAYHILAGVYVKQNQIPEAEQTYEFILQLDPRNELAYVRLAEIAEGRGELHKAVDYYQEALLINDNISTRFQKMYELLMQLEEFDTALEAAKQAVALEGDNPKYLDNLVEASIIVGDKNLAETSLERLRMANPENKKLEAFRQRVKDMR